MIFDSCLKVFSLKMDFVSFKKKKSPLQNSTENLNKTKLMFK